MTIRPGEGGLVPDAPHALRSDLPPTIPQIAEGFYAPGPFETDTMSSANSKFIVVGEKEVAILEPGEPAQVAPLLHCVRELGIDFKRITYIIPTHVHTHHSSAIPLLLKELPNAMAVVHKRAIPHMIDPTKLNASTKQIWGDKVCADQEPVPADRLIGVEGGEIFDLGGRKLEIVNTEGHASHHIAIFDHLTRTAVVGDAVSMGPSHAGGRIGMTPPMFHVEKSIAGLRRLKELNPIRICDWQGAIAYYQAVQRLDAAIEDALATERIVLKAMREKQPAKEIARRLKEYDKEVGMTGLSPAEQAPQEREEAEERGPVALYRYLIMKYPELEMPEGAIKEGGGPERDRIPGQPR
ncbi:MAG: MBL fold metallo-hydrolase [Dehalococcoidales bacterium]|nr:MBL fold metallo-hydrolase [Dehalococcoidales bacterium]